MRIRAALGLDDYMETYFSVTPGDAAASGLPVFGASDGFKDVGVSLDFRCGSTRDQPHPLPVRPYLGVQPTKSGRKPTSALKRRLLGVERTYRRHGLNFGL